MQNYAIPKSNAILKIKLLIICKQNHKKKRETIISLFYPNWSNLLLLKPRSQVVTCPEVIEQQTNPTCGQNYNCCKQFTDKANRLLQDVNYTPNCAD